MREPYLDPLCIDIEKLDETDSFAVYEFAVNLWGPDLQGSGRNLVIGRRRGILKILKQSNEVELIEAMPGDERDLRFERAARKIARHWTNGQLPDRTQYAAG